MSTSLRCTKFVLYLLVIVGFASARAGSYEDFFTAIKRDDSGVVTALLQRGFDPNTRDPKAQVGLFLALQAGSWNVADVLGRHPQLEADALNTNAESPLMMAALRGRLDWCERLVRRGAKINRDGWTPLHYAATSPNQEVVAWLIAQGATVNARSPNGTTPLMMAAGYGTEASVATLMQRGADVRVRNQRGLSAADFARAAGRDRLAQTLDAAAR
jgi:hypothetical protein